MGGEVEVEGQAGAQAEQAAEQALGVVRALGGEAVAVLEQGPGQRELGAVAELAGRKVVLLQDPAAPPEQALLVLHENREAGKATLLDLHANARIRRHPPPVADEPPASPVQPPPDPPPARPLALRQFPSEENP